MTKIEEAQDILKQFGLPPAQYNKRSALILLALCNIKEDDNWKNAESKCMTVVGEKKENSKYEGILRFLEKHYGTTYADNSRETFRRQTLHQFVQAKIVEHNPENPGLATNSKDNHYRISREALDVIRTYGTKKWKVELKKFISSIGTLTELYQKKKDEYLVPVTLSNGKVLKLSAGKHNKVQAAIIEQFASRFAKGSKLLYLGDTANKELYIDKEVLLEFGIPIDQHSKLPDVMIYDVDKNWLYLIEAVTSHGPVSPKRIIELEKLLKNCSAGKIYVTAFPDFAEFKKHVNNIAWETEVWIADIPEHMIHFNGDKFFGPRS